MLGIIGGTGLYKIDELKILETRTIETPFGKPSAPITIGELGAQKLAFLPRHGSGHELLPYEINFRANIYALKKAGAQALLSVSAVGSLKEEVKPGDLALPNQYIDFTRGQRAATFFGQGLAAHVSTADPVCADFSKLIFSAAGKKGIKIHSGLTYACVEGPRLGTRAESQFFRQAGCGLVGMTNVPEVHLAREAQLAYASVCIATDYDCWMEDPGMHAQVDKIMELYAANLARVKSLIFALTEQPFPQTSSWASRQALKYAVLTKRESIAKDKRDLLGVLEA